MRLVKALLKCCCILPSTSATRPLSYISMMVPGYRDDNDVSVSGQSERNSFLFFLSSNCRIVSLRTLYISLNLYLPFETTPIRILFHSYSSSEIIIRA